MLRCGVSVSPISRWEHHNIYLTHKLMGFPTLLDNWEGYTEADLTKYARKNVYFLVKIGLFQTNWRFA